jgi:hypothetical protein
MKALLNPSELKKLTFTKGTKLFILFGKREAKVIFQYFIWVSPNDRISEFF